MIKRSDIDQFLAAKTQARLAARQRAALQLACGIDFDTLKDADATQREEFRLRVGRALRRERQKGLQRHCSCDLNRHIALKQVLDGLGAGTLDASGPITPSHPIAKKKRHLPRRRRLSFLRNKPE